MTKSRAPRPPSRLRLVASGLVSLGVACGASNAQTSACRELEIKLDLKKAQATLVEINQGLFASAANGCEALARRLLAEGASLQARDRLGARPLAYAARAGWAGLVELFLQEGAAIDARTLAGATALQAAAENGHDAAVELLLRRGADPNLPGRSGVTPLAAAAYQGNEAIVALLLAHRADPALRDTTGKTAMVYAAARGFPAIVQRLLAASVAAGVAPSVVVDAPDTHGLTALMWAAGHEEGVDPRAAEAVVGLLLDRGAAIDATDDRGRTALIIAAERGDAAVVGLLLERGADRASADKQGKTALDLATSEPIRARLSARP